MRWRRVVQLDQGGESAGAQPFSRLQSRTVRSLQTAESSCVNLPLALELGRSRAALNRMSVGCERTMNSPQKHVAKCGTAYWVVCIAGQAHAFLTLHNALAALQSQGLSVATPH